MALAALPHVCRWGANDIAAKRAVVARE